MSYAPVSAAGTSSAASSVSSPKTTPYVSSPPRFAAGATAAAKTAPAPSLASSSPVLPPTSSSPRRSSSRRPAPAHVSPRSLPFPLVVPAQVPFGGSGPGSRTSSSPPVTGRLDLAPPGHSSDPFAATSWHTHIPAPLTYSPTAAAAAAGGSDDKLAPASTSAHKHRTRPAPLSLHLDVAAATSSSSSRTSHLAASPSVTRASASTLLGGSGIASREEELRSAKRLTVRMSDEADKDFLQGPLSTGDSAAGLRNNVLPRRDSGVQHSASSDVFASGDRAWTISPATGSDESPLSTGVLSAELDRLSLLGRTVRQNLQARPLPLSVPSSSASGADPILVIPPAQPTISSSASTPNEWREATQLDYDPLNREIVRRASLGPRSSSTSSLPGSRGGLTIEPLKRRPQEVVAADELERLLQAHDQDVVLGRPSKRRRLLIIDTRPLPAFLGVHLAHSAHVVMPSLLVKRCSRNGARQWTGGWSGLAGFISTDGGRRAWRDAFDGDHGDAWGGLDVVLVGEAQADGKESESARVVETVARHLAWLGAPPDVRVRWLTGGMPSLHHERWDRLTRTGEKSLEVTPTARSWQSQPMPQPILTPSPEEGHDLALLKHAAAAAAAATAQEATMMLAPPPPPRTASVPSLRSAKRQPPRPMRIDTTGANSRSATLDGQLRLTSVATAGGPGRPPPKLNLDTGNIARNKVSPPPLTSVHLVAHAQSGLPPSPSSFGGVTRRVAPGAAAVSQLNGRPPPSAAASPWTTEGMMSSGGAQSVYPLLSPTDEPTASSFVVSTILPSFLFLGPEIATESDVQQLLSLGIRRILNVAVECEAESHLRLGDRFEKYLQLPLRDCVDETNVLSSVRQACAFLDDARLHSSPTYVHCRAGKSRSATVVLGYLIHANAWTFKRSYAYVSERRPGISPNLGFVSELYQFEASELGLRARIGPQADDDEDDEEMLTNGGSAGNNGAHKAAASSSIDATHSPRKAPGASPRKTNKAYRESLPPMWSCSSRPDDGDDDDGSSPTMPKSEAQMAVGGGGGSNFKRKGPGRTERGIEREVRKNGQYVHTRKHPVDEQTLQPTRRASKAGLESLRNHLISPQLSPSLFDRKAISQTPGGGDRVGWL